MPPLDPEINKNARGRFRLTSFLQEDPAVANQGDFDRILGVRVPVSLIPRDAYRPMTLCH